MTAGPVAAGGLGQPRRGLAIVAVLSAMSLVVLDAGMANVALPTLARVLQAAPEKTVLVVTAYQLALVMTLFPCAALGERYGNRPVFQVGVGIFILGSILCALAPTLPLLIAARFLQGLGGAAVMALGVALLRFSLPPGQLGAAVGRNALTVAISSAAAPTIGALIVARFDWSWLFLINLPVGVVALVASRALPAVAATSRSLDLISFTLNGAVFALLVLGVEALPKSAVASIVLGGAGLLALILLLRREAPKEAPLAPIDLLRDRPFRISVIASMCCFIGQAAGMIALPFQLQNGFGQTPLAAGLYMSVWPLAVALTSPVAGRLSDRMSTAWLCAIGGAILALGLGLMALWPAQGDPRPLAGFAALCGVGFGLFQTPNNRNMFMSAAPERSGAAGSLQGAARLTGQISGAVVMTLLFGLLPMASAPRTGLALAAACALIAGLVSVLRSPGQTDGMTEEQQRVGRPVGERLDSRAAAAILPPMCGRFDTSHLTWAQIHEQLSLFAPVATPPQNLEPNDDVRPTTSQLTARLEDGRWTLEKMRWGLVPFWRNGKPLKDTAKGARDGWNLTTFNCRVEPWTEPDGKLPATFKGAFAQRRCIVPASSWYEWTGDKGAKTRHAFQRADGAPIWFAGLWDRCTTPDLGEIRSFTIMVGPSSGWLGDYHDRAPVILEPAEWGAWLDPGTDAVGLLRSLRPERFHIPEALVAAGADGV